MRLHVLANTSTNVVQSCGSISTLISHKLYQFTVNMLLLTAWKQAFWQMNSKLCIHGLSISEPPLLKKANPRCDKVTHPVEHVSANTRRHQLGCGNWYVQCVCMYICHTSAAKAGQKVQYLCYASHTQYLQQHTLEPTFLDLRVPLELCCTAVMNTLKLQSAICE